ncbi:pantothenate kinase [Kamptonema formosum]|uniref:pantothenate kinase n=1 Tax=Kamptonema formosum TaxID=331992 RepID=UPI00036D7FD1|nr:pantothenate kinase [Oscillatoria sp. PCC 10802]
MPPTDLDWLALSVGNTRLHWARFTGSTLEASWDTPHLPAPAAQRLISAQFDAKVWLEVAGVAALPANAAHTPPTGLWVASVVPEQLQLWLSSPGATAIALDRVPLRGVYPTLGIDRALAVWGAGTQLGWPVLVIDAGTALTLTGASGSQQLVGGAILPGLRLQLMSLAQKTAALPEVEIAGSLPPRWANDTPNAIASGVIYTTLAGVQDFIENWWQEFPESAVALTGGDSTALLTYMQTLYPEISAKITADKHFIFWGMRSIVIKS